MASEPPQRPMDGELNAAITRAVVRVHSQYVGRGPTKAQTFYRGPVVVTVMENALTKAEQSLVNDGEIDMVLGMRQRFQRTMREDLVSEIERLTGQKVVAFMSDNHVEPDLAAELFFLDGPASGTHGASPPQELDVYPGDPDLAAEEADSE